MELKERSPEARIAYLQGYQAAVRHAAGIAEQDLRSVLAREYGYEPKFHKVQRDIATQIWKLADLAKIVNG